MILIVPIPYRMCAGGLKTLQIDQHFPYCAASPREEVCNLVAEYGLAQPDVFASAFSARSSTTEPWHRDPATSAT